MVSVSAFYITFLALCPAVSLTQNVGTCSGKINSGFKINYSKIDIYLYTKSGSLYESTDCAPNNGYFVIPVYDKGEYVMKVSPPEGWGFEPTEVAISYNGVDDLCSLNKDIVFSFTGFSVSGQVNNIDLSSGPRGVKISIISSGSFKETESTDKGFFTLSNIFPGEYTITGSHSSWKISEKPVIVTVTEGVIELPNNSIVVEGYDVQGFIRSQGEPVAEVMFLLYVENNQKVVCDTSEKVPILSDSVPPPSCVSVSTKDGVFSFQSLPTGTYRIVPYYQSDKSMYQVSPSETLFDVINDSVIIKPNFEVQGFSVYGKVLHKERGEGLSGVNVIIDGQLVTTTDSSGYYQLLNVTAGTYNIMFTAPKVEFDSRKISLSPSSPEIVAVYPARYSVCGKVVISVNPLKPFQTDSCSVEVTLVSASATPTVSSVDSNGLFCLMLATGKYNIKIIVNNDDSERGLVFIESLLTVNVDHTPIDSTQLTFTQFTGELTAKVNCLGVCGKLEVTLVRLTDNKSIKLVEKVNLSKGKITFDTLLPGEYYVSLTSEHDNTTCWKEQQQTVTISSSGTHQLVEFVQGGYKLEIKSTHETDVRMIRDNDQATLKIIKVLEGRNTFCLEEQGGYSLMPKSCHVFDGDMYMYLTSMPLAIEMEAFSHRVYGTVKAPKVKDLKIFVFGNNSGNAKELNETLTPKRNTEPVYENDYIYKYSFIASPGTIVTIETYGTNHDLLCMPTPLRYTVEQGCPEFIKQINCSMGIYLKGTIDPPLVGVAVTILLSNGHVFNVITDKKGIYKAGPMPADVTHTVEPVLNQYVFHPVSEEDRYNFKAVKKSIMIVEITDSINSSPLTGTLVSVNGDEFRSTDLANDIGLVTYHDLHPGEYYIKPILREYEFFPASQMIELSQGEDLTVNFTGKRVAFSVGGKIMSLNKTPLQGAIVQITSNDETCKSFVETCISDEEGQYKFRGIMPTCSYFVSVVTTEDESIVETAIPMERYIQISEDVSEENFVTILKPMQTIITGNVVTPTTEHMNTLKVVVYSDKYMDSILYTVSPDIMGFFTIILRADSPSPCYVQLETSLSHHYYSIETNSTQFSTTDPSGHVTLYFSAQPAEASTVSQSRGSFFGILLAVGGIFLLFNISKLVGSIQPSIVTDALKQISVLRKTKRR